MRQDFDICIWRKWYDNAHMLGKKLKNGTVSHNGVQADNPLTKDERDSLMDDIGFLLKISDDYINKCFKI